MTNEKAINILHWLKPSYVNIENFDFTQAIETAIEALEKQIPMKPMHPQMSIDGRKIIPCGYCEEELPENIFYDYCPYCGQKIKR